MGPPFCLARANASAAGGPPAKVNTLLAHLIRRYPGMAAQLLTDPGNLLSEAERERHATPLVMPEADRICRRVTLQYEKIERHVFGDSADPGG
jgi:hypothetical protein